jgi:hypothetical protein
MTATVAERGVRSPAYGAAPYPAELIGSAVGGLVAALADDRLIRQGG